MGSPRGWGLLNPSPQAHSLEWFLEAPSYPQVGARKSLSPQQRLLEQGLHGPQQAGQGPGYSQVAWEELESDRRSWLHAQHWGRSCEI